MVRKIGNAGNLLASLGVALLICSLVLIPNNLVRGDGGHRKHVIPNIGCLGAACDNGCITAFCFSHDCAGATCLCNKPGVTPCQCNCDVNSTVTACACLATLSP